MIGGWILHELDEEKRRRLYRRQRWGYFRQWLRCRIEKPLRRFFGPDWLLAATFIGLGAIVAVSGWLR